MLGLQTSEVNRGETMNDQHPRQGGQALSWNGTGGQGWVAAEEVVDPLFQPFNDLLANALAPETGGRVLDVGCGTGSTTVAAARRLGARGSCTGIDIAEPMIAAARLRAQREQAQVTFILADAQTHPFQREGFDTFISRFGVMFFDDPVRAFTNLRAAAATGATLRCIVWRSAAENPFMTTAERAAAPLLPGLPTRLPDGPGQFAFADRKRVEAILIESGWSEANLQPVDVPCAMPERALVRYLTQLGPVGRLLQQSDDGLRARVIATVRPAFAPYVHGHEVRFTAACWLIGARA
jgi:SAM-dependent methyltransferase